MHSNSFTNLIQIKKFDLDRNVYLNFGLNAIKRVSTYEKKSNVSNTNHRV